MNNKVKIITFNGVDGAGKTTILREFKNTLESKYSRTVKELRHRPSIIPILSAMKYGKKEAEERTTKTLPRTGKNNSKLSSYLRFFYYLMDYIIGQLIVYYRYTRKDIIVIYDRYYFDFINDSQRSNINLSSGFIEFFYRFLIKPDLNIFLFASPEIILSRKKEMDEETILALTTKYKNLFNKLSTRKKEKYVCIENINKSKTIKTIEELYKNVN